MDETTQLIIEVFERLAERLERESDYLTQLDSEIGDADFGVNLTRGIQATLETIDEREFENPSELIETVGLTLIDQMAGSSGILFGRALMEGSDAFENGIRLESVAEFAIRAADTVESQGNTTVGSKTMFDAIYPIVHVVQRAAKLNDLSEAEASAQAAQAARYGANFTIPIRAKKGRSSYTEWRSVGHPDPGAVAIAIAMDELHHFIQEQTTEERSPYLPGEIQI